MLPEDFGSPLRGEALPHSAVSYLTFSTRTDAKRKVLLTVQSSINARLSRAYIPYITVHDWCLVIPLLMSSLLYLLYVFYIAEMVKFSVLVHVATACV